MFALQPKPTFQADVSIPIPGGKDGVIKFDFKHKGRKAARAFYIAFDKVGTDPEGNYGEMMLEIISGWTGVDTPFDALALEALLDNYPAAVSAILSAYSLGLVEGKQKN